jgi:hypothetical protein
MDEPMTDDELWRQRLAQIVAATVARRQRRAEQRAHLADARTVGLAHRHRERSQHATRRARRQPKL